MLSILKFEADWCQPCQDMKPIVEQLRKERELVVFSNVDVENNPQLRAQYGVRSIPTFIAVKEDKEVNRKTGSCTLEELRNFVDECWGL